MLPQDSTMVILPAGSSILVQILTALSPVIVGALVSIVVGFVKRFVTWVNNLPDLGKTLVAVVFSFLATMGSSWLGFSLPSTLGGFTPELIQTVLTALAAMGLHAVAKAAKRTV